MSTLLSWIFILIVVSLAIWWTDGDNRCKEATKQIAAYEMCKKDSSCFLTIGDMRGHQFWIDTLIEGCEEDD